MSKLASFAAIALLLTAPVMASAERADTGAEVNASTPDITARGEDYSTYQTRNPSKTVRTTTTTYTTTTRRGVGQAVMGDEHVFRPYRTFTRTIEAAPAPVVTHTTTYSSPDDSMTMEQEADMLLNSVGDAPMVTGETVIIHE